MPSIQFTRRAIKDLKRLSAQAGLFKVPEMLLDLQQEKRHYDTIKLKNDNHGLKRMKYDRLRLIFQDEPVKANIIVKAVKLRNEYTYNYNYNALSPFPRYQWQGEQEGDWLQFVTETYRHSPVLTEPQQEVIHFNSSYPEEYKVSLIQAPPGTGKTLTAFLKACEYYQENKNIVFIVPRSLIADLRKLKPYQDLDRTQANHFFLGTFWEWLTQLYPNQKFAAEEEELTALNQSLKGQKNHAALNYRDLVLYRSFIENHLESNQLKNPIYQDHQERIEKLKELICKEQKPNSERKKRKAKRKEQAALEKKFSRSQFLNHIFNNQWQCNTEAYTSEGTFIFVDEAQDYLLTELEALFHISRTWKLKPTHLWLFGDLNQRIQPVNFTWGNLKVGSPCASSWENFRNSKRILEFANSLLALRNRLPYVSDTKWLSSPGDPSSCVEEGDRVRLIIYNSKQEADRFLEQLTQAIQNNCHQNGNADRFLLQELSRQVKVLVKDLPDSQYQSSQAIRFLTVEQVKGQEFESSIAFRIFDTQAPLSQTQIFQWYTLLTRTRSRLLIVATQQEIEAIGEAYFTECQKVDPENLEAIHQTIHWVVSEINDANAAEQIELVKQKILQSVQQPSLQLYWDMYDTLRSTGMNEEQITHFEQEHQLLTLLEKHSLAQREQELSAARSAHISTISLQCLLLRSMGRSWEAVEVASQLISINEAEYQRLLQTIATDLEQKGLSYEAARVQSRIESIIPDTYPYPEVLNQCGKLIPLLYERFSAGISYLFKE